MTPTRLAAFDNAIPEATSEYLSMDANSGSNRSEHTSLCARPRTEIIPLGCLLSSEAMVAIQCCTCKGQGAKEIGHNLAREQKLIKTKKNICFKNFIRARRKTVQVGRSALINMPSWNTAVITHDPICDPRDLAVASLWPSMTQP